MAPETGGRGEVETTCSKDSMPHVFKILPNKALHYRVAREQGSDWFIDLRYTILGLLLDIHAISYPGFKPVSRYA